MGERLSTHVEDRAQGSTRRMCPHALATVSSQVVSEAGLCNTTNKVPLTQSKRMSPPVVCTLLHPMCAYLRDFGTHHSHNSSSRIRVSCSKLNGSGAGRCCFRHTGRHWRFRQHLEFVEGGGVLRCLTAFETGHFHRVQTGPSGDEAIVRDTMISISFWPPMQTTKRAKGASGR